MSNEGNATSDQGNSSENTGCATATGRAIGRLNSSQPESDNQQDEGQKKERKWGHNPDTWMVLLTAILAIVGGITLRVFYRQFQEMSNQTGILRDQAKQAAADSADAAKKVGRQLEIAQQQADAARLSAAAAQRSATELQIQTRLDERPWLNEKLGEYVDVVAGQPLSVPVQFHNVGKTAAFRVHAAVVVEIIPNGQLPALRGLIEPGKPIPPEAANSRHKIAVFNMQTGLIYPGDHTESAIMAEKCCSDGHAYPIRLLQPDVQAVYDNKSFITVWGKVWYSDVFGIEHWTTFCIMRARENVAFPINVEACQNYNHSDRNYLPPKAN